MRVVIPSTGKLKEDSSFRFNEGRTEFRAGSIGSGSVFDTAKMDRFNQPVCRIPLSEIDITGDRIVTACFFRLTRRNEE